MYNKYEKILQSYEEKSQDKSLCDLLPLIDKYTKRVKYRDLNNPVYARSIADLHEEYLREKNWSKIFGRSELYITATGRLKTIANTLKIRTLTFHNWGARLLIKREKEVQSEERESVRREWGIFYYAKFADLYDAVQNNKIDQLRSHLIEHIDPNQYLNSSTETLTVKEGLLVPVAQKLMGSSPVQNSLVENKKKEGHTLAKEAFMVNAFFDAQTKQEDSALLSKRSLFKNSVDSAQPKPRKKCKTEQGNISSKTFDYLFFEDQPEGQDKRITSPTNESENHQDQAITAAPTDTFIDCLDDGFERDFLDALEIISPALESLSRFKNSLS